MLRDVMINIAMDKHVPNSMTHKSTTLDTVTSPSPAEWNCLLTVSIVIESTFMHVQYVCVCVQMYRSV